MSAAIQSREIPVFDEDGLLIDPENWNPSLVAFHHLVPQFCMQSI